MGVYKHNGLLKASIMSATNAHRLGANEAPPAIISSFLGKQLSELLDHIEKADKEDLFSMDGKQGMKLDIPEIPELLIDNTDRNRTSPFAFTGNRFEFRAVGSEANCASAMITLNSAVAEALASFKKRVDEKISDYSKKSEYSEGSGHSPKYHAIIDVLREDIKTCKPIRFDGNGYSDEWKAEAARRGLDTETSCPVIFERYLDRGSKRSEVGDLHEEDSDRSPCAWRPLHEPHHPCRHQLPEPASEECRAHVGRILHGEGQPTERPQPQAHRGDCRTHSHHRNAGRGTRRGSQGC